MAQNISILKKENSKLKLIIKKKDIKIKQEKQKNLKLKKETKKLKVIAKKLIRVVKLKKAVRKGILNFGGGKNFIWE